MRFKWLQARLCEALSTWVANNRPHIGEMEKELKRGIHPDRNKFQVYHYCHWSFPISERLLGVMKEMPSLQFPTTRIAPSQQGQAASSLADSAGWWQRLAERVFSSFRIPYGYEDENGFHYGHEPAPRNLNDAQNLPESTQIFTDRACDAMVHLAHNKLKREDAPLEESHQTAKRSLVKVYEARTRD